MTNLYQQNTESTAKKKGDALEKNVEFIFQSAGFKTQRNIKISKYEIDVFAEIGDRKVIIECKNYQESSLTIRNIIHQWNSKNQLIKANKIILVFAGLVTKQDDYELADKFNIEIWNEQDLTNLFNLTLRPEELRDALLKKVSFKPVSISEIYRDKIASIIIRTMLTGSHENEEKKFELFNHWIRTFIRTELQINNANKDDRIKHINLFEGIKEKNAFFNLLKVKRKEVEYWNILAERLKNDKVLDDKTQEKYSQIMRELIEEYDNQKQFFQSGSKEDKIKKLILGRLNDALVFNNSLCLFGFNISNIVEVLILEEGNFCIRLDGINDKHANLINWILTSEYYFTQKEQNNVIKNIFSWSSSSPKETAEKVYRILEEFFSYDKFSNLMDYSITNQ